MVAVDGYSVDLEVASATIGSPGVAAYSDSLDVYSGTITPPGVTAIDSDLAVYSFATNRSRGETASIIGLGIAEAIYNRGLGTVSSVLGTGIGYPIINIGDGTTPYITGLSSSAPVITSSGHGNVKKPLGGSYLIPYGTVFQVGSVKLSDFSGESDDPLLNNSNGNIYISPSFFDPNPSNELLLAFVESSTDSSDSYLSNKTNQAPSQRPFVFGPAVASGRPYPPDFKTTVPSYIPSFNNEFVFMGTKKNSVSGVLLNTTTMVSNNLFY